MIDLETEYKNFENTWLSLGANFNNFSLGEDKMYHLSGEVKNLTDSEKILSLSCINTALAVWLIQAREKQLEIDSLKAQLAKIESGEFVVVPKNPSLLMQCEYYKNSVAPVARLSVNGYRAMIKAAQENSHDNSN